VGLVIFDFRLPIGFIADFQSKIGNLTIGNHDTTRYRRGGTDDLMGPRDE